MLRNFSTSKFMSRTVIERERESERKDGSARHSWQKCSAPTRALGFVAFHHTHITTGGHVVCFSSGDDRKIIARWNIYRQLITLPRDGCRTLFLKEKKNKRKEIHSHTRAIVRIIVSYASSDRKNTEEPNKTVKQYKLTSTKRTHSPHIGHHWRFGQNPLEAGLGRRSALKVHHSSSTSVGLDIDGWKKWTYKLYLTKKKQKNPKYYGTRNKQSRQSSPHDSNLGEITNSSYDRTMEHYGWPAEEGCTKLAAHCTHHHQSTRARASDCWRTSNGVVLLLIISGHIYKLSLIAIL